MSNYKIEGKRLTKWLGDNEKGRSPSKNDGSHQGHKLKNREREKRGRK